ncbi:Sir2p [Malassezia vespertilionis]|uniref:Sir2p n=1 Tax=Malassezia vespertilionis TaxID=2020962 RepID=A0A2N1JEJ8_9BASI|nr:Sir2p [Malassezia vespertilionis]
MAADKAKVLEEILQLDDDYDSEELDRLEEEAEEEMEKEIKQEKEAVHEQEVADEALRANGADALPASPASTEDAGEESYGPLDPEHVAQVLSDLREHGMIACLQKHIVPNPFIVAPLLLSLGVMLPRAILNELQDDPYKGLSLLKLVLTRILRKRRKLAEYNTVEDVLALVRKSKRIVVLSGAGISVSCGIPDFRSKDGIYSILAQENQYELDDPSDMFDKEVFLRDPSMFYSFAHAIYPSHYEPSPSHRFIKLLEEKGKLLRMYSQNIDTLEQKAGIQRVLQCHGSFATATCTDPSCRYQVDGAAIREAILSKNVPQCPKCTARRAKRSKREAKRQKVARGWTAESASEGEEELAYGIMKPDITFFGEKEVDLIMVMGTSLKVAPVADLLSHLPPHIPTVLINRTPITHMALDVMLLGDADCVVAYLCDKLDWTLSHAPAPIPEPLRVASSHVHQFPGAEGGWYVEALLEEEDG